MLIALVFALTVVIITVLSHLVRELVREKEDRALQVRNYNDELQHRSSNMVQILVNWIELGLKRPDPAEYFAGLSDKLIAWSRSNAILQHSLAGEFNFTDVVELACRPFDHGRIARQGPNPEIGASAARAVVLAIHELATNATKHGALSIPSGHVQMSWEPGGDDTVRVQWLEHGRPATFTAETAGSGLRFLASLTDLHHFQIAPTAHGIMCTFEILQVRDPDRFAT
jgi:two-component sensor histidine kinase